MRAVSERALSRTVETLLLVGETPISVADLAELTGLSPEHQFDVMTILKDRGMVTRFGGRRGVAFIYKVQIDRARKDGCLRQVFIDRFLPEGTQYAA